MGQFGTGPMVATPGAAAACARAGITPLSLIERHVSGDWGDTANEPADAGQNRRAIATGTGTVQSIYTLSTGKEVWVWTYLQADPVLAELPDYHYTTVLLPDEY